MKWLLIPLVLGTWTTGPDGTQECTNCNQRNINIQIYDSAEDCVTAERTEALNNSKATICFPIKERPDEK